MTASEARKLTNEAAKARDVPIDAWVKIIDEKIEAAAKNEQRQISDSLTGYRMPGPTAEQLRTIVRKYEKDQFKVQVVSVDNRRRLIIQW